MTHSPSLVQFGLAQRETETFTPVSMLYFVFTLLFISTHLLPFFHFSYIIMILSSVASIYSVVRSSRPSYRTSVHLSPTSLSSCLAAVNVSADGSQAKLVQWYHCRRFESFVGGSDSNGSFTVVVTYFSSPSIPKRTRLHQHKP